MKFFPTSSLDRIETPEAFVHATQWDQFRNQFRSSRSQRSGYRNCVQASDALNQGDLSWDQGSETCSPRSPFSISLHSEHDSLEAQAVDSFFAESGFDSLCESIALAPRETVGAEQDYDLELGLLESVQELAISLSRNTPVRTQSAPQNV